MSNRMVCKKCAPDVHCDILIKSIKRLPKYDFPIEMCPLGKKGEWRRPTMTNAPECGVCNEPITDDQGPGNTHLTCWNKYKENEQEIREKQLGRKLKQEEKEEVWGKKTKAERGIKC